MLHRVAVLYHPHKPKAVAEAEWLFGALRRDGVQATCGSGWDPAAVQDAACDSELVIVLGGDGTIIHVARLVAPHGVPIMGVNLGRIGFLAEMTPEALHHEIDALVREDFWIEHRTMLEAAWGPPGHQQRYICLNEVVLARGLAPRAIHVDLMLDGDHFTAYTADGVIIATATGSTAYSLAAGGPILYPESKDIVITPVAPHLHIGRSTVVPGDSIIHMQLVDDRPAVVSVDGSDEQEFREDFELTVQRSPIVAHFARLGPCTYFYSAIADRL